MSTTTNTPKLTAFLYEADDARAFLKDRPAVGRIITLTPNARAALLAAGIEATPSSRVFTDRHQRQITARIRRADRQLCAMFDKAETPLGEAAKETLRHDVGIVAMTALKLWVVLGKNGPYLVRGSENWCQTNDRLHAFTSFRSHLVSETFEYRNMIKPPRLPRLVKFLNRSVARLMRGRTPVLVTAYQYGLGPLAENIYARGVSTLQLSGSRNTKGDYLHPLLTLFNWATGNSRKSLVAGVRLSPQVQSAARKALDGITDPVIRLWLDVVGERLAVEAGYTEAAVLEFNELIRRIQPKALIGHTFRWSDEAALAEAAGDKGLRRLLMSHGSHALQDDPFALEATTNHARGLLFSPLADTVAAQSPHAERLIKAQPGNLDILRVRPVMWGYKPLPDTLQKHRSYRILHAGTYKTFFGSRPMMYETSDEFIDGLSSLIEAVRAMADTELVIRVRPAPECSISTLRALLPEADNCTIKTDGNFLDDLAEADLLVSYSSTTLEEAIHAGRPALLWGGGSYYRHLPARKNKPTKEGRSAVYSAESADDLTQMIEAILRAHTKEVLTKREREDHCWEENVGAGETILEWIGGDQHGTGRTMESHRDRLGTHQ